jgi:hypothetical protein
MFTREISTEIEFSGTPDEAWTVLADLRAWPEWNPGVRAMEGEAIEGTRLRFATTLASGRKVSLRPRVLVAEPGRELRWRGRLVVPGIFDGTHRHRLETTEPGRVRYVQSERFRGVLVPFLRRLIDVETVQSFAATNEALARRVAELRERSAA